MDCNNVRENINAYIDGELSEMETRLVVAHIDTCESCRHEFNAYKDVREFIAAYSPAPSPPGLSESIRVMMEKERLIPKRRLMSGIGGRLRLRPAHVAVAASFIVVALGIAGVNFAIRSSSDEAGTSSAGNYIHRLAVAGGLARGEKDSAPAGTVSPGEFKIVPGYASGKRRVAFRFSSRDRRPGAVLNHLLARHAAGGGANAADNAVYGDTSVAASTDLDIIPVGYPADTEAPMELATKLGGNGGEGLKLPLPVLQGGYQGYTPIPDAVVAANPVSDDESVNGDSSGGGGNSGEGVAMAANAAADNQRQAKRQGQAPAAVVMNDAKNAGAAKSDAARGETAMAAAPAEASPAGIMDKAAAKAPSAPKVITAATAKPAKPPLNMTLKARCKDPEACRKTAVKNIMAAGGKAEVRDGKIFLTMPPADTLKNLNNIKSGADSSAMITVPEKLLSNEANDANPRTVKTEIIFVGEEDK